MRRSSLSNALAIAAAAACLAACSTTAPSPAKPAGGFGIGRIATAEEIRGWDIDVSADGRGLPVGAGSVAEGRAVYAAKCSACHGAEGGGGTAPSLVGGIGTLATPKPVRTVGSFWPYAPTVYDYVQRAMPWDKPMSMTQNETYAVVAYLLFQNKLIAADAVMNAQTLPAVRMPNRDGFVTPAKDTAIQGNRCMENC